MEVKGNHPLAEILAKKLFGIETVPLGEKKKMVNRAIKAAVKYHKTDWKKPEAVLPKISEDEYYGNRYSVPVIVANENTMTTFTDTVMWDYHNNGWVLSNLSEGPDPDDYEMSYVSHWANLPHLT